MRTHDIHYIITATKIIYELTNSERHLKGMLIIPIKGEHEYYFVYGAESKNFEKPLSHVEIMLDSLEIFDHLKDSENDKNYKIPPWIRNNARWWREGQITDKEFFDSLQYLR